MMDLNQVAHSYDVALARLVDARSALLESDTDPRDMTELLAQLRESMGQVRTLRNNAIRRAEQHSLAVLDERPRLHSIPGRWTIVALVAGVKAMNVDLGGIKVGEQVALVAEPTNPYDPSAIAVHASYSDREGAQHWRLIGYLQRELAALVAPQVDRFRATVVDVLEFEGKPAGLLLDLERVP